VFWICIDGYPWDSAMTNSETPSAARTRRR
jgi:hypothetical protein